MVTWVRKLQYRQWFHFPVLCMIFIYWNRWEGWLQEWNWCFFWLYCADCPSELSIQGSRANKLGHDPGGWHSGGGGAGSWEVSREVLPRPPLLQQLLDCMGPSQAGGLPCLVFTYGPDKLLMGGFRIPRQNSSMERPGSRIRFHVKRQKPGPP